MVPAAEKPAWVERAWQRIREEVGKLVSAGYKEVVLIGIHLGCYGKELAKEGKHVTLYDAVKAALSVEGVQNVLLTAPAADLVISPVQAAHCSGRSITYAGTDE